MRKFYFIFSFLLYCCFQSYAQPGNGFTCQEAACLDENLGVTLNNGGSPPTSPLNFSCGVTHNNLFYAFCPETGPVTLDITPSNCITGLGVQAIIYETDDCVNFLELVCISNGIVDPLFIHFSGTPGQTYILMIDGFSGDVCDFTVSGTGIADITEPPLEPELDPDDNPITLCAGEQLELEITNDEDQSCTAYFWEIRSGLGFVALSENGPGATIYGISEGIAELCVVADNFCYETEYCVEVEVTPPPRLDPVDDVTTCEQFVDFCDIYSGFFDSALSPDPYAEGWSISFHRTFRDAEMGINPIACPYDLSSQTTHTIYVRVYTGSDCYTIQDFEITFQLPVIEDIFVDPVCDAPVNLLEVVVPRDINGLTYTGLSYYENEQDAYDDVHPLDSFWVYESGQYCVRVETDFGCFDVKCFDVQIVSSPEIEVEDPPVLCWTEDFEFNLDSLRINELTGRYNPEDLDIRWYEDIPLDDSDLDFFINPKSIVYQPGTYYVTAVVLLNSSSQRYCHSPILELEIDPIRPEIDNQNALFSCEEEEVDLSMEVGNTDVNGLTYTRSSFFESKEDALRDVGELNPPVVDQYGWYWQRVETENGCIGIDSIEFKRSSAEDMNNWEIDVDEFGGIISVELSISGEDAPFVYEWSDGFIGSRRWRLNYGDAYDVTVTNNEGCATEKTIYIRYPLPLYSCDRVMLSSTVISSNEEITISGPIEFDTYEIVSLLGEPVVGATMLNQNRFEVSGLNRGVYYVFLSNEEITCTKKIVVQ